MLNILVKMEAESSYLGFWVPKHIYSDTRVGHYGQFLQSLKHHYSPVWYHNNSKIAFLGIFVEGHVE